MSEIEELEIRDVDLGNVDDLINLCIPSERRDDPLLLEGIRVKRRWAAQAIERYGNIGKIAYLNSEPAGLIQYQPRMEGNGNPGKPANRESRFATIFFTLYPFLELSQPYMEP